jgi:hypothetical protein
MRRLVFATSLTVVSMTMTGLGGDLEQQGADWREYVVFLARARNAEAEAAQTDAG